MTFLLLFYLFITCVLAVDAQKRLSSILSAGRYKLSTHSFVSVLRNVLGTVMKVISLKGLVTVV